MVGQRSAVDAWFDQQSHAMTSSARLIRDAILRAVHRGEAGAAHAAVSSS